AASDRRVCADESAVDAKRVNSNMAEFPPISPYQGNPNLPANRPRRNIFGWVLFIGLGVMLIMLLNMKKAPVTTVPFNEFTHYLTTAQLSSIWIAESDIVGELKTPQTIGGRNITRVRTAAA